MDLRILHNKHAIRYVICMFCTWTWYTGKPAGTEAKCPQCSQPAGVEEFVVLKPGGEGYMMVRPDLHFTV